MSVPWRRCIARGRRAWRPGPAGSTGPSRRCRGASPLGSRTSKICNIITIVIFYIFFELEFTFTFYIYAAWAIFSKSYLIFLYFVCVVDNNCACNPLKRNEISFLKKIQQKRAYQNSYFGTFNFGLKKVKFANTNLHTMKCSISLFDGWHCTVYLKQCNSGWDINIRQFIFTKHPKAHWQQARNSEI